MRNINSTYTKAMKKIHLIIRKICSKLKDVGDALGKSYPR